MTEEELEQVHPDLDNKLPSPTMNSSLMDLYHNELDNFIDNLEYFHHYFCWILSKREGKIYKKVSPRLAMYNWMEDKTVGKS